MSRLARIVISGLAHHATQRANRRDAIFFEDGDQEIHRDLMAEQTRKARVAVWAYCLMPKHVHLIVMPGEAEDLGRAVGETHRRYTNSSTLADVGRAICCTAALRPSTWTTPT